MFVKSIISISYTSDTALGAFCIAVINSAFGDDGNGTARSRKIQSSGKTGKPAADNQMVKL
jgi:hypothetical protein